MPSNVIELVVKVTDQASAQLRGIAARLGPVISKALIAGAATAALAVAAALGQIIRRSIEAQKATAQLDAAYKATGSTLGLTRQRLDQLGEGLRKVSVHGGTAVKTAQSVLLTFNRVRGEAFGRTLQVAADLSARLGTDLTSAVRVLGAALQDPERGLQALRRAGISFSDEQRELIKRLVESGQAAKAQAVILGELEARFTGSAAALRNTLGGALEAMRNAWGDLFEQSADATADLTKSINDLTKTLEDEGNKRAVTEFFALIVAGAARAAQAVSQLTLSGLFNLRGDETERITREIEGLRGEQALSKSPSHRAAIQEEIDLLIKRQRLLLGLDPTRAQVIGRGGGSGVLTRFTEEVAQAQVELEEFIPTVRRIVEGPMAELQRKLGEDTATAAEKARKAFGEFRVAAQEALAQGTIKSVEQFNERIREAEETILGLEPFEVKLKRIDTKPLQEFSAAAKRAAEEIQQAFAGAFRELATGGSLRNALRKFLEAIREIPIQIAGQRIGEKITAALMPTLDKLLDPGKAARMAANEKLLGGAGPTAAATTVQAATATVQSATASVQTATVQAQAATANVQSAATQLTAPLMTAEVASVVINAQRCVSNCASCVGGGDGGSGFDAADLLQFVSGFAGGTGHAPGGLAWVGEAGRELVALPRGSRVLNQRQVAAAGGGNLQLNYQPVTSIVIEGGDAKENRAQFAAFVAASNARTKKEIIEMLQDNGFGRLRT